MVPVETLASFFVATLLICAVPGPTVTFLIGQGLFASPSIVALSIGGIIAANVIWMMLSYVGIATILHQSPTMMGILQIVGSLYLAYLALKFGRAALVEYSGADPRDPSPRAQDFRDGFMTSMSNPKAALFYLFFIPQFIDPALPPTPQLVTLALITFLTFLTVFSVYGYGASHLSRVLSRPRVNAVLRGAMSAMLLWAAIGMWFVR